MQLKEFLAQSNRVSNKEEYNVYFKKFMKELSKMDQLQDQDKIYLLNNSFAS